MAVALQDAAVARYGCPTEVVSLVEVGYRPCGSVDRRVEIAVVVFKIQIAGQFVAEAAADGTTTSHLARCAACAVSTAVGLMAHRV